MLRIIMIEEDLLAFVKLLSVIMYGMNHYRMNMKPFCTQGAIIS
jgi:hypothetical protein